WYILDLVLPITHPLANWGNTPDSLTGLARVSVREQRAGRPEVSENRGKTGGTPRLLMIETCRPEAQERRPMARGPLHDLLKRLRWRADSPGAGGVTDGELLRRFATGWDQAAFELLVWRHGGMVFNTCCRVLGRSADAEDAFQATFLALVRKA